MLLSAVLLSVSMEAQNENIGSLFLLGESPFLFAFHVLTLKNEAPPSDGCCIHHAIGIIIELVWNR